MLITMNRSFGQIFLRNKFKRSTNHCIYTILYKYTYIKRSIDKRAYGNSSKNKILSTLLHQESLRDRGVVSISIEREFVTQELKKTGI